MNRRYSSKLNGKKGGRPAGRIDAKIELPNFNLIILTHAQYNTLLEKYGYSLLNKAFLILENWLKNSPGGEKSRGKNNYAQFRADGWLINTAKQEL